MNRGPLRSARETLANRRLRSFRGGPMAIVAGFDVHRAQITFDALDRETGEVKRGRIAGPPGGSSRVGRPARRRGASRGGGGGTGWLFVCEALSQAGASRIWPSPSRRARYGAKAAGQDRPPGRPLAADPVGRGSAAGGLVRRHRCASGAPGPGCARHWSTSARAGCRGCRPRFSITASWARPTSCSARRGRAFLDGLELPDSARERIEVSLSLIEAIDRQLAPLEQSCAS